MGGQWPSPRLVITGGEPLLQASALRRMLDELEKLAPFCVEVETNGTIAPSEAITQRVHQFNVSPKLAHSGNAVDLAIRAEALACFVKDRRAFFKFVVAAPGDVGEVLALAATHAIAPPRIWLMPEGRDSATLRARLQWLRAICEKHHFNLSDRLHIHLHGDTRGT